MAGEMKCRRGGESGAGVPKGPRGGNARKVSEGASLSSSEHTHLMHELYKMG